MAKLKFASHLGLGLLLTSSVTVSASASQTPPASPSSDNAQKPDKSPGQHIDWAIPTIIFMDGNGNVLWQFEGAPAESPTFVDLMKKVMQKFETENQANSDQQ